MKLHELLAQYTWEEVCSTLKTWYGASAIDDASYKKAISALRETQWVDSKYKICVHKYCDEQEGRVAYDVGGNRSDVGRENYDIAYLPWREWLGMEIEEDTLQKIPKLYILSACVGEMTSWGYSERQRMEEMIKEYNEGQMISSKYRCADIVCPLESYITVEEFEAKMNETQSRLRQSVVEKLVAMSKLTRMKRVALVLGITTIMFLALSIALLIKIY